MLSVVIPARNAERGLAATLAALDQPGVAEVVVVDNGSSDGTARVAAQAGARVVAFARPNRGAARNHGVGAATGELIGFLDADCRPDSGWAAAIERCLGAAPLVGGAVRIETSSEPAVSERFDSLWRFRQERTIREGRWAASANLAVTRDAFERLGGFDESYVTSEDVDFCVRAARLGLEIRFCPDAIAAHPASRSVGEVLRRGVRQGLGSATLHARLDGAIGRRYWRHPGGIVRREAALRALGVDPEVLEPRERRALRRLARAEYLARCVGSAGASLRRR